MAKISFLTVLLIITAFNSCNFSKGAKKDLSTGLLTSYNGFSIDDAYLAVDEETNRVNTNKITLGSKLMIVVTGVNNFEPKNAKVFPGCTIILTDESGKELLNLPDAFSDMVNGTTPAEAKTLQASLNTGSPMVSGATYHLKARFFDKNKKENEIVADIDLVVQ